MKHTLVKLAGFRPEMAHFCNPGVTLRVSLMLCCLMLSCSVNQPQTVKVEGSMQAMKDASTGHLRLMEDNRPILRYNYQTVEPGEILNQVTEANLKYARPRSNYIHPLYGLDGEELTLDWPVDHPHHRGIYWAWPEVRLGDEMGDLHALQRVFARPDDDFRLTQTDEYAEFQAENSWLWEDQLPMVSETSFIRAYSAEIRGRLLDFEFHWTALEDGISVARRNTNLYGGLNVRLSAVKDQKIEFYTDPESARPRMAWAQLSGIFEGGKKVTGVSIFQHQNNPDYPGDWVEYPEINWFQPTFPAADSRYAIRQGETLILRYRMWIHQDRVGVEEHREIWHEFNQSLPLSSER